MIFKKCAVIFKKSTVNLQGHRIIQFDSVSEFLYFVNGCYHTVKVPMPAHGFKSFDWSML